MIHPEAKKFHETARAFNYKRRTGHFILVEEKFEMFNSIATWFKKTMDKDIIIVPSFQDAYGFLENDAKNIKCIISSVPSRLRVQGENFLQKINRNYPGVVSVAYTEDSRVAQSIQENCPRATVVCMGSDIQKLMKILHQDIKEVS